MTLIFYTYFYIIHCYTQLYFIHIHVEIMNWEKTTHVVLYFGAKQLENEVEPTELLPPQWVWFECTDFVPAMHECTPCPLPR